MITLWSLYGHSRTFYELSNHPDILAKIRVEANDILVGVGVGVGVAVGTMVRVWVQIWEGVCGAVMGLCAFMCIHMYEMLFTFHLFAFLHNSLVLLSLLPPLCPLLFPLPPSPFPLSHVVDMCLLQGEVGGYEDALQEEFEYEDIVKLHYLHAVISEVREVRGVREVREVREVRKVRE